MDMTRSDLQVRKYAKVEKPEYGIRKTTLHGPQRETEREREKKSRGETISMFSLTINLFLNDSINPINWSGDLSKTSILKPFVTLMLNSTLHCNIKTCCEQSSKSMIFEGYRQSMSNR